MTRILLTTTSFQDTPGRHHDLLAETGWEVVTARGPLNETDTLALVGEFDGYICGDDAITRAVLEKARPRLKVLSKYGIGVDKIDVASCTEFGIPLLFTPGVNHTTVAEHTFLLLLALEKHLLFHADSTRCGGWKRKTGHELLGKTIGIVGMGRIGKEVAIRARAFGMPVIGYDLFWDDAFAREHGVVQAELLDDLFAAADVISLHLALNDETRGFLDANRLARAKRGVILVNTARAALVEESALLAALTSGHVRHAGLDVFHAEPLKTDHPLARMENVTLTSHAAFRTLEASETLMRRAIDIVCRLAAPSS